MKHVHGALFVMFAYFGGHYYELHFVAEAAAFWAVAVVEAMYFHKELRS